MHRHILDPHRPPPSTGVHVIGAVLGVMLVFAAALNALAPGAGGDRARSALVVAVVAVTSAVALLARRLRWRRGP